MKAAHSLINEALCVPRTCDCGAQFTPTRKQAKEWVRKVLNGELRRQLVCSPSCAGRIRGDARRGVPREGGNAAIEHNVSAKFYCVRSPDNVEYKFRNMNHFVRSHPELFSPEQLRTSPNGVAPNAVCGLRSLFTRTASQRESYRGWVGVWKKDRLGSVIWQRAEPSVPLKAPL